ncbi:hypothetical protein AVEN_39688-1 [Araneus ventricosus]|uniref:Uncharacterized protein n=1 Tax=Araneus ventricosus TaxID=182803 RepID=A0A4Y1ZUR1_ARAVE|nr:hypothetical protein AVEN_39688-1 [Araneus ventricosus]
MPRHSESTLRCIVKCRASSTTTALIAVREVKLFEVDRERAMFREDNILSNLIRSTRSFASWSRGENEQLQLVPGTLSTRRYKSDFAPVPAKH